MKTLTKPKQGNFVVVNDKDHLYKEYKLVNDQGYSLFDWGEIDNEYSYLSFQWGQDEGEDIPPLDYELKVKTKLLDQWLLEIENGDVPITFLSISHLRNKSINEYPRPHYNEVHYDRPKFRELWVGFSKRGKPFSPFLYSEIYRVPSSEYDQYKEYYFNVLPTLRK